MIDIKPGTERWRAWLEYARGSKLELVMLACERRGEPFKAYTELPPDHAQPDRLTRPVDALAPAPVALPPRRAIADGEVDQVADRLEQRARAEADDAASAKARSKRVLRTSDALEQASGAVLAGQVPSLEGLADFDLRLTDDPNEVRQDGTPKRRAKLVALRDDPIGQMAKRGQLADEADAKLGDARLSAARLWQALYDAAQLASVRSFDPCAMKVDGGRFAEPLTDRQRLAIARLVDLDSKLGEEGAALVRRVLGDRFTVAQAAAMAGDASARGQNYMGRRLRECLDTLVRGMGITASGWGKRAGLVRDKATGQMVPDNATWLEQRHAERMRDVPQASARDNREAAKREGGKRGR